ncbi:MAG: pantoate--beta-alanine ligase [Phycisphaerae bacterium]|jgi:pantoate--beta-alanine ligase|nr:pantoate--beta-alanine ligase [Phycisphaerae bacterium]
MKTVQTIAEVRRIVSDTRAGGATVGFVPTMGGLHEGHLSLIDAGRNACDFVVVSIFVNPTQFAPGEDLSTYPRNIEADLAACDARGADLVFVPTVETMYPRQPVTSVAVSELSETLCGRDRPTHFAGVCTVVVKLLNIVGPDKAFFGQKDFQQLVIITRMVGDLDIPVEIVPCPIVRETDGLAMSTRNQRLSAAGRRQAVALHGALEYASDQIRKSHPPPAEILASTRAYISTNAPDGEIDYIQIVDPQTLCDVETTDRIVLVALAVKFPGARLIDNMLVDSAGESQ